MAEQTIGDLIDSLGVTYEPNEGDLVSDAIVILKVVDSDGDVILRTAYSESISWIEKIGMLRAAERVELPPFD